MLRLLVLAAALAAGGAPLRAEVTHIDNAALERLRKDGVPIVDIRTPQEWDATGVIEGSHLLTFFDARGRYDARAWLSALSALAGPEEPVAIICHGGRRSNTVSRLLDDRVGYRRVHNVRRGIAHWIAEGRATTSPGP